MAEQLITISPVTNKPIVHRPALPPADIALLPRKAEQAFEYFRQTPLNYRQNIVAKALDILERKKDDLARDLVEQIGRPVKHARKEIATAVVRGRYLLNISGKSLEDTPGAPETGFRRYIKKVPVGPVLILFAWNVSNSASTMETAQF
jgi:acyl-CoA reductase-like NAD-dependent aldehyde dehydrogenase